MQHMYAISPNFLSWNWSLTSLWGRWGIATLPTQSRRRWYFVVLQVLFLDGLRILVGRSIRVKTSSMPYAFLHFLCPLSLHYPDLYRALSIRACWPSFPLTLQSCLLHPFSPSSLQQVRGRQDLGSITKHILLYLITKPWNPHFTFVLLNSITCSFWCCYGVLNVQKVRNDPSGGILVLLTFWT